jgi:hypothetical protein
MGMEVLFVVVWRKRGRRRRNIYRERHIDRTRIQDCMNMWD